MCRSVCFLSKCVLSASDMGFICQCISIGEDVFCLSVRFFSVLVSVLFVGEIVFLLVRLYFLMLKCVVY